MMHEDIKERHRAETQARIDEERERQRDLGPIPDPRAWAWELPKRIIATLTSPECITRGSYCATEVVARALRPYGLCDYASRQLTVFGCAVLKELLEDER